MAGATMTADVCDLCWGSGDEQEPFADQRESLETLRKHAATIAELRAALEAVTPKQCRCSACQSDKALLERTKP